jgi:riboflavin synthase
MFTGIVQAVGTLVSLKTLDKDRRATLRAGVPELSGLARGESICVGGVCVTVVDTVADGFIVDLSAETLARTMFTALRVGDRVNLERALTPTTRLGGHLVTGHVDGVGTVRSRRPAGRAVNLGVQAPAALAKYIAVKGSICMDGASLTVNAVRANDFEVSLIPYTLANTTLGELHEGACVNLEVDIVARYLERLLQNRQDLPERSRITAALLAEHGFLRDT